MTDAHAGAGPANSSRDREASPPAHWSDRLANDWFLPAAVLIGLLLRIGWAWSHGLTIEQEGAEYARIAQNLLAGKGYVGIFNNGVQLNFPPLYPAAIALVSLITGDAEIAARSLNIILGALLVVPVYRIAVLLYGRSAGIAAAVLVVLHPVLLAGSASTYSEGVYVTIVAFALWSLVRWVLYRRLSSGIAAGSLLGAAYLVRPEAFVLAGFFGVGGLVFAAFVKQRRETIRGSIALLAAFAVVAAPNVAFLTYYTGQLRIEAKGTLAYQWGQRINQGMSYAEAVNGIGPDLSEQGVFMRPNLDVIRSTSYSAADYVRFVLQAVKKNVGPIVTTMTGDAALGSPFLFALVVLGFFGTAWPRDRWLLHGLLVVYALTFVLVLMTVQELWFRYFYALFVMLLFWSANGAERLRVWTEATVEAVVGVRRIARGISVGVQCAALLLMLKVSFGYISSVDQFRESMRPARKEAGLWLSRQDGPHERVMASELQTIYYAGADLMPLPYADSDLALRYIAKRNPDYIVLVGGAPAGRPYADAWFENGIPSPNARLVYDEDKPGSERVKIFRWSPSSGERG